MHSDIIFMQAALDEAAQGQKKDEVPVGALIVYQGTCIAQAHNAPITTCDPTAHAEIRVLRLAAQRLGNYRLNDCQLYVTLEPCSMCAGAIINARIARLIYGAADPKTGACGSVVDLFSSSFNHHTVVQARVMEKEAGQLLTDFFRKKRICAKALKARS